MFHRTLPHEPEYYGLSDVDLLSLPWNGILSVTVAGLVIIAWGVWVWNIFRKETGR